MSVPPLTVPQLRAYCNATETDDDFLQTCVSTAQNLVEKHIEGAEVPEVVLVAAQLEVGLKLYARRNAPNGSFNDGTGAAVYAPREVMLTATPLLDPFLPLGFA